MTRYTRIRDFHGSRRSGVGSSDIPTLAGLNLRYGETPYTLWREKTGRAEPWDGNDATDWGHRLEGLVLSKWIEEHYGEDAAAAYLAAKIRGRSYSAFKAETEARHPDYPFALAHADLLIDGAFGTVPPAQMIVEAKSTRFMAARRDDDEPDRGYSVKDRTHNGIPASVFLQNQWQLFCYRVHDGRVVVLVDTSDWREYGPIVADARVQERCLALAERFWWHVEHDTPPKPETWADVADMWPATVDKTSMVGGDDEMRIRAMLAEYKNTARSIKELDERQKEIKNALGIYMGENSVLVSPEGVKFASSWNVESEYVGAAKVREGDAELWSRLVAGGYVTTSSRRELRPAKLKG